MHRQSIQMYWMSRWRHTRIASRNDWGRSDSAMPDMCFSSVACTVISGCLLGSPPQQWESAAYRPSRPAVSTMRTTPVAASCRSSTLFAGMTRSSPCWHSRCSCDGSTAYSPSQMSSQNFTTSSCSSIFKAGKLMCLGYSL